MHEVFDQLIGYVKATWRYRWYAVGVAWGVAVGGWIYVYTLPNRYEANARVYVDTQSVLRPLLAGLTIQPNVDQMIAMMSRTLISRPNLEKVIRMADMDIKLKTAEEREALIYQLSRQLYIRAAGGDNLYTIAYASQNPQEAKRVVQSLLTMFVEGSLGDKRKDSDGARRFLDEQLKVYNDRLIAAENAVTEFKRKNVSIMRGGDYYSRLGEAQAALNQSELELKEVENARDAIKRQLSGEVETPSLLDEKGASAPTPMLEVPTPEFDARISALEQKLDGLRLTYTEQHPDIIALHKMIAQLKEQKKTEAKNRKPSPTAQQGQNLNPIYQQLTVSLTAAEASVASMHARVAEYKKRLEMLKGAVNAQPQVEAEFVQLTRDYNVTQRNYETLLSRRESAQMSGEMESNAGVIDFRVIDPPTVPSTPSSPNRVGLTSMVLLVALGAGIGVAFLLSQVRPTFTDEKKLREISGLPVFGTVVMAWTDAQRGKRRKRLIAFMLSFMSLFSAYGALLAMFMLMAPRT
jgi:polysaccharide chain length determinant protein (PEP-CTERM system associated)